MDSALPANLLSIVTLLPLLAGLGLIGVGGIASLLGLPSPPALFWRIGGLVASLVAFALSLVVAFSFDPTDPGIQFVEYAPWVPDYGMSYFVGVDGISLFLVVLTAFLMPIVLVASWTDVQRSVPTYVFFMLFLETGMLGAFVSLNLLQFYLFWEVMLIPMYFIIGIWGGPRRIYAAVKFFLFTMVGSLLMLVATLVVSYLAFRETGALSFDLMAPPGGAGPALLDIAVPIAGELVNGVAAVWWQTQGVLFLAFALAFAIKVPMVPFHTWLPDAHVEAPTGGSVVLAAVLLKMGTYGFLRFALPLFPVAALDYTPLILRLALVGIVYGALVAMVQSDIKKLIAYSSIAHLGFVMLGMFALNVPGVNGSVLQMVNHGLSTGALFLLVGMLYERRHTREISAFGGVAKPMPVFAAFFGIATFSSIGLPALNGFVGEFLILIGAFEVHPKIAVGATFGLVLAAAYMLWMFRRVMFGPVENPENRSLIDLGLREKVVMVAMVIPIFWIGLYPDPFIRRIEPSVIALLRTVDERAALGLPEEVPEEDTAEGEAAAADAPAPEEPAP